MGHLLRSVDGLRIRHPSIPGGLSGNTQAHMPCPLRTMPLAGALFAALAGAALATSANAEETVLGTVDVRSTRDAATLHLDQPTQSGSRTGVTAKELPASLEILDSETIRERGDTQMRDTLSRTVGLTDTGRLSFSSRGFTGETSVGIADDGIRVTPGAQTYPGNTWGYERFDVSRGPASVVYGTGTVGATINAIRKEPSRTRSYELMAGLGTDGYKQIGVGAAGPIGEIASYRIDAYGHNDRGFRELGDSRGGKLMSRLRLQPTVNLRIDLTADYSLEHPERYWGTPYGPDGQVPKALRKKNYNINDAQMRYEDTRLRAKVDWQVNDWLGLSNEVYFLESDRLWKNVENYKLDLSTDTVTRTSYVYAHHDHDQRQPAGSETQRGRPSRRFRLGNHQGRFSPYKQFALWRFLDRLRQQSGSWRLEQPRSNPPCFRHQYGYRLRLYRRRLADQRSLAADGRHPPRLHPHFAS